MARAMAVADRGDDMWDVRSEEGDDHGYVGKNEYRAMARAAIAVMREPTEAMIVDGDKRILRHLYSSENAIMTSTPAENCFRAMIDAAIR